MQADFVLDYDTLPLNTPQRIHLMARFVSGPAHKEHTRRPLNLSVVLDRSGSMAGQKLDYTRQAAQFLVQNLSNQDILSVVLYNDKVETLLMPEKVLRKDAINQRIAQIKASGTTNLSSGWLEGCKLVGQNLNDSHLNRVILMSDGLANRGVTDTAQLVTMSQQKFQEKISTTAMGLGTDFNEDLMMEMASAGGGAFYFIESPEVTPTIFQEELQGLLNVVGQNLNIGILPADVTKVNNQLNAYPTQSDGQYTSFRMGDVFADEVKALVLELGIAPITEAGRKQVATLRFEYDELTGSETTHRVVDLPIVLNVGIEPGQQILPNPDVTQSVLLLQAAQARRRAVRAADRGEFQTAAHMLRSAAESIGEDKDANLREEKQALIDQASQIEKGATQYDVYSRKTMSTQAFYTMHSRHEDTVMLRVREAQKRHKTGVMPGPIVPAEDKNEPPIVVEKHSGVAPTHVSWNAQTFELKGDVIRIGRAQHNEIVIAVKGVSRFHCHIKRQASGKLMLEDLGSTNGTMVGGKLLEAPHELSVGDVAYLCDEKLIFHDMGNTAAIDIQ